MGKCVSATGGIHQRLSTIAMRLEDIDDRPMHNVTGDTLNAGTNPLARNRAAHEDDTPIMPREHAAARDDLFRNEYQLRTGGEHIGRQSSVVSRQSSVGSRRSAVGRQGAPSYP
jgi:hypothetical protein